MFNYLYFMIQHQLEIRSLKSNGKIFALRYFQFHFEAILHLKVNLWSQFFI
jgi:hypothetical protein